VSTGEDTSLPPAKPHRRLTRSRVLWSIAGLCLLVWGLKTIHHALQSKYQGKTAEEWFADFDPHARSATNTTMSVSWDDPALLAYRNFGPEAARFLWEEYNHQDSKPMKWVIGKASYWSSGRLVIESGRERNFKAFNLLQAMGPKADCLLPELNARLKSADTGWDRREILRLLNVIGPKDKSKLPILIANLSSADRNLQVNSLDGLRSLGVHASSALPALENMLQTSTGFDQLNVATVMIALGDQSKLKLLQAEIQDPNTKLQGPAFLCLASLTEDGVDVVPILKEIAQDARSNPATKADAISLIEQISARKAKTTGSRK